MFFVHHSCILRKQLTSWSFCRPNFFDACVNSFLVLLVYGIFPVRSSKTCVCILLQMRGKSSCRKHDIHSKQPPEQHTTKTREQHECKWLQKHEDTHLLREIWEYCLGTVSDEFHWEFKPHM